MPEAPSAPVAAPVPDLIPERIPRVIAAATLAVAAAALLPGASGWPGLWILAVLVPDFALRAAGLRRFSYLGALARTVLRTLPARGGQRQVYAAPKRFAAGIGLVFLLAILGCHLGGWDMPARLLLWMLAGCAALECVLGFCVACRLYSVLGRLGVIADACPDGVCVVAPPSPARPG